VRLISSGDFGVPRLTGANSKSENGEACMAESNPLTTQKVAVGGMTCVNCEILVQHRLKTVPGVEGVRADHGRGFAEIDYRGELDTAALQRAVEQDGYRLAPWDETRGAQRNSPRDYAEIAGLFIVLGGLAFALAHFGLMPRGFAFSDTMSLGLVFLIGLVASVSSCMAVTGGLLVAAAATYNERTPGLGDFQRLKPHLYFNAGRIISYTLLGGTIGALGSALTLSEEANGILTIMASAIMIVLGLQMLGLLPRVGGSLLPRSIAERVHELASRKLAGGAFTLGALTFFLPCGFTQALQLYVLGKGSFGTGALTMLVFALGTLPALLSLSALSSFAKGAFQKHFLRVAGAAVIILGALNIQYGLVLSGLGGGSAPAGADTAADSIVPVSATQGDGKQVVTMRVVDFTYIPAVFEVKQGIPVEWRIDASQAVGCGLVLLAPRLGIRQLLSSASTSVVKFTPRQVGEFQFNCGMGMMSPWEARFIVVPAG
jgi:sulfite exporter TauE/SafE/copper chaperone CopZ